MKSKNYLLPSFINLILLFLVSVNLQGQSLKGTWYGMPESKIVGRLILHIDSTQKGYQIIWEAPDDGFPAMPVNKYTLDYPYFSFEYLIPYEGIIEPGYKKITGFLKLANSREKMNFIRDSIPPDEKSIISIQTRYNKQEVSIPMRDGVKLFTSIYTPKDSTKPYPMLMMRSPYNSEPEVGHFNSFVSLYYRFIKENYIIVFQDVRGRYMSEGKFEDIRPYLANKKSNKDIDEASDTYDAVDWLVKNVKYNNGKMGVMGGLTPDFILPWRY